MRPAQEELASSRPRGHEKEMGSRARARPSSRGLVRGAAAWPEAPSARGSPTTTRSETRRDTAGGDGPRPRPSPSPSQGNDLSKGPRGRDEASARGKAGGLRWKSVKSGRWRGRGINEDNGDNCVGAKAGITFGRKVRGAEGAKPGDGARGAWPGKSDARRVGAINPLIIHRFIQ